MKYQKYTFSILFLAVVIVATPSLALGKVNNLSPRIHKDTFTELFN
jgi:hypothetical protein